MLDSSLKFHQVFAPSSFCATIVEAAKCNLADSPIPVHGVFSFITAQPAKSREPQDHETSNVLLAIGLAIGLIVSTFAQQKEPSLSEQDRSQIVAGREATARNSSAFKPIDQAALQAAVDATAEVLFQFRTNIRTSEISPLLPRLTQWRNMLWHSVLI